MSFWALLKLYSSEESHLGEWDLPINVSYVSAIICLRKLYVIMLARDGIYKCCVCTLVWIDASHKTFLHRNESKYWGRVHHPLPHLPQLSSAPAPTANATNHGSKVEMQYLSMSVIDRVNLACIYRILQQWDLMPNHWQKTHQSTFSSLHSWQINSYYTVM